LAFIESDHISTQGLGRLLKLIEIHLPEQNNFFKSTYAFFKILGEQEEPVKIFYFCSKCYRSCDGPKALCGECKDPTRSVQHFISIPLLPQIRKICQRPGFISDFNYKNTRVKENPDGFEDVYDGRLYKEIERNFSGPGKLLTLFWNTDGLQAYNSSSYSLWPWYFVILELPPEKRFRRENMILCGIWGSVTKPHPNIYLQPIYQDVKALQKGIEVQFDGEENTSTVSGEVLGGTGDAPAVSCFLNLKYPTGFYSCFLCEIKGVHSPASGNVTVFPFEEYIVLRTMERYNDQVKWAHEHKVLFHKDLLKEAGCCGVKGPTLLSALVPDIFSSTAIDSMHCLFLGLTRALLHLWFDREHREESFSLCDKISFVNQRLVKIKLPHFVERVTELIEELPYWKASLLRTFLLYLALCILFGLLPTVYFNHLMLLVEGVALLNTSCVLPNDVSQSKLLLYRFVKDFQTLYGLRNMTSNLHKCLHLSSQVPNLAPLWALNCWPFEDMNGRLASLIHGSRFADLQIFERLSIVTDLPLLISNMPEGPAKMYCIKLHQKFIILKLNGKIAEHVYCVGSMSGLTDARVANELVIQGIVTEARVKFVQVFHRLLKNGLLYIANSYGRGQRVSSYAQYGACFGNIECFVRVSVCECLVVCACPQKYFAVINPLETAVAFQNEVVSVGHIFTCKLSEGCNIVEIFDLSAIMYKCAFSAADTFYLSKPLNQFELE